MIIIKSPQEIGLMRSACEAVAHVLLLLGEKVKPGITTLELNAFAEREVAKLKSVPAFKGYSGYPYALCCSLNGQVVHGMPNGCPLNEGDILSLDFGAYANGFYGDAAVTIPVGQISTEAEHLIRITRESLDKGIAAAQVGNRLSDISSAIQVHAESHGFSIVRDFVGHGIGRNLHESPQVPNYGAPGRGVKLKPGMVLAIEPMINQGSYEVRVLDDGWTAVTVDGKLSAHFEHTVAITDNGPEILTALA